jgi:hypothetical protein
MVLEISVSCVIDGELTACDAAGVPDFRALHFNSRNDVRCVWAFDLLYLNGKDWRRLPLVDRKERLERLVSKVRDSWLCYVETFTDGVTLLKAADRMGLEGDLCHHWQRGGGQTRVGEQRNGDWPRRIDAQKVAQLAGMSSVTTPHSRHAPEQ